MNIVTRAVQLIAVVMAAVLTVAVIGCEGNGGEAPETASPEGGVTPAATVEPTPFAEPTPSPAPGAGEVTECPSPQLVTEKCPWTPEGYTVNECAPGMCWDGGPQGSLACKQAEAPPNSHRSYTGNVLCDEGYEAVVDPCTANLVLECK